MRTSSTIGGKCSYKTSTTTTFSGNSEVGESRQEAKPLLGEDHTALDLARDLSLTGRRGGASTSGVQASGGMACCVRKFAEKTVERAFEAAEERQVGQHHGVLV